jgi:hypothetical protein
MLVMASKAAGIQALDTVFTDVKDLEGLRRDASSMKKLGFDGKGAIHPGQIPVIHEVYTPTPDDIQHAVRVIRAAEEARAGTRKRHRGPQREDDRRPRHPPGGEGPLHRPPSRTHDPDGVTARLSLVDSDMRILRISFRLPHPCSCPFPNSPRPERENGEGKS